MERAPLYGSGARSQSLLTSPKVLAIRPPEVSALTLVDLVRWCLEALLDHERIPHSMRSCTMDGLDQTVLARFGRLEAG